MENTKNPVSPFKIYVIHHAHTDLGYTDTQEKMKRHQIGFIREVISLLKADPDSAFKWNCETSYCVEEFLRTASPAETADFSRFVKEGKIGLSLNFLNLTEAVTAGALDLTLRRVNGKLAALGLSGQSALTADINGYAWGFADILLDNGVRNLMSNIHTHHGYHPLFRKQTPFWWESPKGGKLLVWVGEHYLFGNELGIARASEFEYTIQDGLSGAGLSGDEKADKRIGAYVDQLRADEAYPYSFVPVNVSGNMTDNSPPSLKIPEFIADFNRRHDDIRMEMVTLDQFFAILRAESAPIPAYRGDWTDWWADGIASTPSDLMFYRQACRKLSMAVKADPGKAAAGKENIESAISNMVLYSEHTWGYSSSVSEPFHPQVNRLDQWKRLFALKADEAATVAYENVTWSMGETPLSLHRELYFRAVNPNPFPVHDMLTLDLEHFYGHHHFKIIDRDTGKDVKFQLSSYSRGPEICIDTVLDAGQAKTYRMVETPAVLRTPPLCAQSGIEGVSDLSHVFENRVQNGGAANAQRLENDWLRIEYKTGTGITSIYDKRKNRELADRSREYPPFTPVYEVTRRGMYEDYQSVRRNMGRNRKMPGTCRSAGRLSDIRVRENGDLYTLVELSYQLDGMQDCAVLLKVLKQTPRMYVDFRFHKASVWEPENVYLSFNLTTGGPEQIYADKTGCIFRPRIDQLPGSCIDFYSLQNGFAYVGGQDSLLITMRDTPLLWMGPVEWHPIKLMGEGEPNVTDSYAWVMNNFWETNFKASLGGFYQFRYAMTLLDTADPKEIFRQAEAVNEGTMNFCLCE